jgi:choline dehydrogenase
MARQALRRQYDYVIAGGGTAGCVLAGRLSEDPSVSVLLIEAGRNDRHPFIHVPAGFAKLTAGPYQWGYMSEAQRNCEGRRIALPQGKVLGGGGSINAQVFTRGVGDDYDRWAKAAGDDGWGSLGVLPYFLRSEGNTRLSGPMHGNDGPLGVSDPASPHPLSRAFVQAGQQYGLPYNADFNSGEQFGVGYYQTTTRNGLRCSAAVAYLGPTVRRRPNLTVVTDVFASRVTLEGSRATGVEVVGRHGTLVFRADREVLVSSGAFGSPRLLQHSGVGDPSVLKRAGVDVKHALPGVGRNLQDHCDLDIVYELKAYGSMDRFNLARPATAMAGLQYAAYRSGPLSSTVVEAGGFSYANKDEATPDLQFHFLPASGAEAGIAAVRPGFGVTLNSYFVRPRSRGSVLISSSDPTAPPRIDPNFLDDDYDVDQSIEGVKQSRDIMTQSAMTKHIKAEHIAGNAPLRTTDDYLRFVRAYGRTSYHPVGSCAMGTSDESVVASDLRVHGMQGLRVVDSSVMPNIVSSNTQAPTVMIAEKAVDLIRQSS